MSLNMNIIVSTSIGLLLSFIFNDLRTLLFSEIIIKIIDSKISDNKNIILFGAKINREKIINLFITIILSIIFILIIEKFISN